MEKLKNLFRDSKKRKSILVLIAYALFMILMAIILSQHVDKENLQSVIKNMGPLGILVFLIIEFVYVVFTPLYNTAIHIGAGYIFGGHLGFVLNFIATTAGLFTIMLLVRKYGRPLLKRLVPSTFYNRYDKLAQKVGPIFLFLIYVLPFTPDDEMTYVVAAGSVNIKRFILPILLGNIAKSAMSYIGDKGTSGLSIAGMARVVILVVGLIAIVAQEYFYKKKKRQSSDKIKI